MMFVTPIDIHWFIAVLKVMCGNYFMRTRTTTGTEHLMETTHETSPWNILTKHLHETSQATVQLLMRSLVCFLTESCLIDPIGHLKSLFRFYVCIKMEQQIILRCHTAQSYTCTQHSIAFTVLTLTRTMCTTLLVTSQHSLSSFWRQT